MSADPCATLSEKLAAGDGEQAGVAAGILLGGQKLTFRELIGAARHAVSAKQTETALILLEGAGRFACVKDAVAAQEFIGELTTLLGICWREKMDSPARKVVELVLHALNEPLPARTKELAAAVAEFARMAGRLALLRKDDAWFESIALQSMEWISQTPAGILEEQALSVLDAWLHRIVKHERLGAVPALFAALAMLNSTDPDRKKSGEDFLREWRVAAATACMNPNSLLSAELVEQLLLFALKLEDRMFWLQVARTVGEVAALAATRNGVRDGFSVMRPLLDVGRVMLGDELKFASGPDPESTRQLIIRLVCEQALRVASLAARNDITAVTGDKLEEMYKSWMETPDYEPHFRSIRRFCQLLLIIWTHKHKRAARKWTPRARELSEPLLITEEEQGKLTFLL